MSFPEQAHDNENRIQFGRFLRILRWGYNASPESWASLLSMEVTEFRSIEKGGRGLPSIEELDDWTSALNLQKEEIEDLKVAGGYIRSIDVPVRLNTEELRVFQDATLAVRRKRPSLLTEVKYLWIFFKARSGWF